MRKICSVEGCDRKHEGLGFCNFHYKRYKKGKRLDTPLKGSIKHCSVEGCDREHSGLGMCNLHYQRFKAGTDLFRQSKDRCFLNKITIKGDIAEVSLSGIHGGVTIIDADKVDIISGVTWHSSRGYAKSRREGYMHNVLLGRKINDASKHEVVDHINRDKLDNRLCNLRITSSIVNSRNRGPQKRSKTGLKGIWSMKGKYAVFIGVNYKQIPVGRFETLEEAAAARKEAEIKYWGETYN